MTDANKPLFPPYDADTSLHVVRDMLDHVYTWRNELAAEIAEPDFGSVPAEYHSDLSVDNMYTYTYRDAACSHAAVGGMAPFFEGIFHHEFDSLQVAFGDRSATNTYHRWKLNADDFWVPKIVSEKGARHDNPDIARGIKQLVKALDIGAFFPNAMDDTVTSLFTFRNFALHNGYEWPMEARHKFQALTKEHGWDSWFIWSKWGDDPWIASVTDTFVHNCLDTLADTIKGFRNIRNKWRGQTDAF